MKRKYDKTKDEFPNFQIKHKQVKKALASNNRNNVSHSPTLHNNISHNTTKSSIAIPTPVNPHINKISPRRHITLKNFLMGLITQIPILGGIVMYEKLVEIEEKVEKIMKKVK